MPAEVVVVLQDAAVAKLVSSAIQANGHTVQYFVDPMQALNALEQAKVADLLITCVQFQPGKPSGQSLARMARFKRPGIQCIFVCEVDEDKHVADLGVCVQSPMDVAKLSGLAEELLARNRTAEIRS